jgi:hypothetical protein
MQEVDEVDRSRNEYPPGVTPFLQKCGAEVPVAGFDTEPAEREPANSTVVIRCADAAALSPAIDSPGSQRERLGDPARSGERAQRVRRRPHGPDALGWGRLTLPLLARGSGAERRA